MLPLGAAVAGVIDHGIEAGCHTAGRVGQGPGGACGEYVGACCAVTHTCVYGPVRLSRRRGSTNRVTHVMRCLTSSATSTRLRPTLEARAALRLTSHATNASAKLGSATPSSASLPLAELQAPLRHCATCLPRSPVTHPFHNLHRPLNGGGPDAGVGGGRQRDRADVDPVELDASVTWDSVGGLEHHVQQLKEMVMMPLMCVAPAYIATAFRVSLGTCVGACNLTQNLASLVLCASGTRRCSSALT